MEKRRSGLKRICNETEKLESYTKDCKPVFKSSTSQFMTIIYSVIHKNGELNGELNETQKENVFSIKEISSLSSHQVVIKLSLSIPVIDKLLMNMTKPISAKNMRSFCGQKDATYFKTNVIDSLIAANLITMTRPDSPKSPTQKYYLTEYGKSLID